MPGACQIAVRAKHKSSAGRSYLEGFAIVEVRLVQGVVNPARPRLDVEDDARPNVGDGLLQRGRVRASGACGRARWRRCVSAGGGRGDPQAETAGNGAKG